MNISKRDIDEFTLTAAQAALTGEVSDIAYIAGTGLDAWFRYEFFAADAPDIDASSVLQGRFTNGRWLRDKVGALPTLGTAPAPAIDIESPRFSGVNYSDVSGKEAADVVRELMFPATPINPVSPTLAGVPNYNAEIEHGAIATFRANFTPTLNDASAFTTLTYSDTEGASDVPYNNNDEILYGRMEDPSITVTFTGTFAAQTTTPKDNYGNDRLDLQLPITEVDVAYTMTRFSNAAFGTATPGAVLDRTTPAATRTFIGNLGTVTYRKDFSNLVGFRAPANLDLWICVPGNFTNIEVTSGGFVVPIGETVDSNVMTGDRYGQTSTSVPFSFFKIIGQASETNIDLITIS